MILQRRTLANSSDDVVGARNRPKKQQQQLNNRKQTDYLATNRRVQTQDNNNEHNNEQDENDELDWYHQERLVAPLAAQNRQHNRSNGSNARLVGDSSAQNRLQAQRDSSQLDEYDDNDGNSSISFVQSGYQPNLLSAWRQRQPMHQSNQSNQLQQLRQHQQPSIGAIDRNADSRLRPINRPISVLSNSSSVATKRSTLSKFLLGSSSGRKSNGSTSQRDNRIPLGPRSAQHFVTNTRRRRRANELILEALEARRRALAIGRQNAASLYGSASYLDPTDPIYSASPLATRLSLTPSPLLMSTNTQNPNECNNKLETSHRNLRSPSPAPIREALSDLGSMPRQRVQQSKGRVSSETRKTIHTSKQAKSPKTTLAKLDQNSSDLCTSNSSSESNLSQISSSGESQFTQLVTSDLVAPDYTLGNQQHNSPINNKPNLAPKPTSYRANVLSARNAHNDQDKPKVAKRNNNHNNLETMNRSQDHKAADSLLPSRTATPEPQASAAGDKADSAFGLRRGALNRDSIRRLRMSGRRASGSGSGSGSDAPQQQQQQQDSPRQSKEAPDLSRPKITVAQSGRSKSFDESSVTQIRRSLRRQEQPATQLHEPHRESLIQNRQPVRADESRTAKYPRSTSVSGGAEPFRDSAASIKEMEKIFNQVKSTQQQQQQQAHPVSMTKRMESYTTSTSSLYQYKKESRLLPDDRLPATTYFTVRPNSESNIRNPKPDSLARTNIITPQNNNNNKQPIPNPGGTESNLTSAKYEDKIFKEKTTTTTTTSRLLTSISPPLEFADVKIGSNSGHQQTRQATSSEPIARLRSSSSSNQPTNNTRAFDQVEHQDKRALNQSKLVERNDSPKFEPTANDELRKRVDQLARLARSNPTSLADNNSQANAPPAPKLVRPLSTNWPPKETPQESTTAASSREQAPAVAASQPRAKPPTSPKPRLAARTHSSQSRASLAATTNLDSVMLLSKEPESSQASSHFEWRRSNSSLAVPQSSQHWPQSGLHSSSASNLDEPKPESQVMKLMVREKSAPRLDYAIVEKQPVSLVQEAREVNSACKSPSVASYLQATASSRRQQPIVVGSGPIKAPRLNEANDIIELESDRTNQIGPNRQAPTPNQPSTTTNESDKGSKLGLQHPRQFSASNRSNSNSTNDDSAIASSISSPSLSSNQLSSLPTTSSSHQSTQFHSSESHRRQVSSVVSMPGILRQRQLALGPPTRLEQCDDIRGESQSPRQHSSQYPPNSSSNSNQTSSNPKRVHFNDRASVRSFESLSSLGSESTAVANEACEPQPQNAPNQTGSYQLQQQARQQLVNSPDSSSLCSSSVGGGSRLSAESPDIRCLKLSEAAIYAVREDPELDDPEPQDQQLVPQVSRPNPAMHPYVSNFAHQNQVPMSAGPIGYRSSPNVAPHTQRQAYMRMPTSAALAIQPVTPRMGPTVSYGLPSPVGSAHHRQIAACQPQSTLSPQVPRPSGLNRTTVDDDEDLSYADQLRRANHRVFSQFGSQSQQPFQASINRRSLANNHDIDNLQTEV